MDVLSVSLAVLVLTGLVRDEAGRPIAGATVVVRITPPIPVEWSRVATTDTDGRFVVDVRDGRHSVGVFSDGFVPHLAPDVDSGVVLDLVLKRGVSLEGVVIDARSREPVAGATVEKRMNGRGVPPPGMPLLGTARTVTEANGTFRLEGLSSARGSVTAFAPGYGRMEAESPLDGSPLVLALSSGPGIYGRVADQDGEPLSRVSVGAQRLHQGRSWIESVSWTESDAGGHFALPGVEAGLHTVVLRHGEFAFAVREVEVDDDDVTLGNVHLGRGGAIEGHVVGPEGSPVEGAVRVETIDGVMVPLALYDRIVGSTESEGCFELRGLPSGEYRLVASGAGFADRRLTPLFVSNGEVLELGDVVLGEGRVIGGVVLDEAREPLAGAWVYASADSSVMAFARGAPSSASAKSGAEGRFSMSGLETGPFRVSAWAEGYAYTEGLVVEAGEDDVVLVLERTGGLAGNVVDVNGAPIPSFTAEIGPQDGRRRRTFQSLPAPSEDGRFVYEDLEPGSYRVRLVAEGLKPERLSDIIVTGGAVTDVGTIVLMTGGAIRGVVVDHDGEPVVNAEISLNPGHPGRSDASGRFEIRGLEVGVIDVRVSHPDFAQSTVKDVELRSEGRPVDLRIELGRGGRLEGVVRDRDGFGLSDRSVSYRNRDGRVRERMRTRDDGTFAAERVEPGLYRVELLSADPNLAVVVQAAEASVASGEASHVEFVSREIRVYGQVLKGDVPVRGGHLALRPLDGRTGFGYTVGAGAEPNGPLAMNAISGADGFYELYVEAPGVYEARLSLANDVIFPLKTLSVPDADSHMADIHYATVTVQGQVVSEETGEPVAEASVRVYPLVSPPVADTVGFAMSGPDGGFELELEPDRYRARTVAEGFGPDEVTIDITESGASVVRIALGRGGRIRGWVVDTNGNDPGRHYVHAVEDSPRTQDPPSFSDWADIRSDGSFEFRDLAPGRYNLLAGSDLLGFAFAPGVTPGEELTLQLSPAAWVDLVVRGPDGVPVPGARVAVSGLNGRKVRGVFGQTDAGGQVSLFAPAGSIEIKAVHGDTLVGVAGISARGAERTSTEIVLRPVP